MKAEKRTFSVYPCTMQQILDIVELKKAQDPSYKQANAVRDSVELLWSQIKNDLNDKRYEEGALNE